jgi:hypothetical protein
MWLALGFVVLSDLVLFECECTFGPLLLLLPEVLATAVAALPDGFVVPATSTVSWLLMTTLLEGSSSDDGDPRLMVLLLLVSVAGRPSALLLLLLEVCPFAAPSVCFLLSGFAGLLLSLLLSSSAPPVLPLLLLLLGCLLLLAEPMIFAMTASSSSDALSCSDGSATFTASFAELLPTVMGCATSTAASGASFATLPCCC